MCASNNSKKQSITVELLFMVSEITPGVAIWWTKSKIK